MTKKSPSPKQSGVVSVTGGFNSTKKKSPEPTVGFTTVPGTDIKVPYLVNPGKFKTSEQLKAANKNSVNMDTTGNPFVGNPPGPGVGEEANQVDPLSSAISQYLMQAQGLLGSNGTFSDYRKNFNLKGLLAPYTAAISSVRGQNKLAKKQTSEAQARVASAYQNYLSQMQGLQAQQQARATDVTDLLNGIANNASSQISGLANSINGATNSSLSQILAPEDAAAAIQQSNAPVAESAAQNGSSALNFLNSAAATGVNQQASAEQLLDSLAASAGASSTNQQADLTNTLQNYLLGNQQQVANLKGERAQAKSGANQSILNAFTKSQTNNSKNYLDALANAIGWQQDASAQALQQAQLNEQIQNDQNQSATSQAQLTSGILNNNIGNLVDLIKVIAANKGDTSPYLAQLQQLLNAQAGQVLGQ